MLPIKATILDDDSFRLLAIPFGGPIPSPVNSRGVDLDGEFFSERTDIKPAWFESRPTDWHHGGDMTLGRTVIGKAVNLSMEEDGWWVDVWLKHGEKRLDLIRRLAERGGQIFGSSESAAGLTRKASNGEILVWPYIRQTLSTSPQNTHSVLRPFKAVLDQETAPSDAFYSEIVQALTNLGSDLRGTSRSDPDAKAGRVLAAKNEADIEEALAALQEALGRVDDEVAEKLRGVLSRQTQPKDKRFLFQ